MTPREQLDSRLQAYLSAEIKILAAQEYVIGNGSTSRRLTRADLAEVRSAINDIRAEISRIDATANRTRRIVYLRPY